MLVPDSRLLAPNPWGDRENAPREMHLRSRDFQADLRKLY